MNPTAGDDPRRLAVDLRPQTFGSGSADHVRDPIVEPAWPGLRVIAAVDADGAVIFEEGTPVEGHELILHRLARQLATTVDGAILDAYLTKQVVSDEGVYTGPDEIPSAGKLIAQSMIGTMGTRRDREKDVEEAAAAIKAQTFEEDDPVNLVIVDLLWLDGDWLLDVPLLERRRLLEAIVPGDDLVRAGMYIRPPIQTWIGSWRAQGFSGITFKEANSRYRPGTKSSEWASTGMPRR